MYRKPSKLNVLLAHDVAILAELATNTFLIGVDEVGRGSCIGPVSAGAALYKSGLEDNAELLRLNDSKQMSAKDRTACYHALKNHCTVAYAEASQQEVDKHNVYQASLIAASRAVIGVLQQLSQPAHIHVLMDGRGVLPEAYQPTNHPNCLSFSQQAIVKGDGCSFAIAAGSVIAKHQRDELILSWAANEHRYGWATNMGYPTPAHKQALLTHGPTDYHRQSVQIVQTASKQLTLTP